MYKLSCTNNVVFITLEDGNTYRLDNLIRRRDRLRRIDEIRQDRTRRRMWYRAHVVSRDVANSKAARAEYGDNGRMVSFMVDTIDGKFKPECVRPTNIPTDWGVQLGDSWVFKCVVAKFNSKRIAQEMMMLHWWRIAKFVAAVWQNGHEDREKTMQDFGISEATYYWRLAKYASILHFSERC